MKVVEVHQPLVEPPPIRVVLEMTEQELFDFRSFMGSVPLSEYRTRSGNPNAGDAPATFYFKLSPV